VSVCVSELMVAVLLFHSLLILRVTQLCSVRFAVLASH
jgi:hypothetical protein